MNETTDVTQPVLIAVTALPGGIFYRANSGLFRSMDGQRFVRAGINGVADIMGAYRSRPIAIETKTSSGKLLKSQQTFRDRWTRAGGVYIVARSPSEALEALEAVQ